jgi:outer membrane biosynthesis protein TonB
VKPEDAKKNLEDLRDSLNEVLGKGVIETSADNKEKAIEFRDSAKEDQASFFQRLVEKTQKLPVVETFSNLGVAGSVAISTAAVTQTDLAKDLTEVFVAEVANDAVHERFEVPQFLDDIVDFHVVNDWGQEVIAEKLVEAQEFVAKAEVSEQPSSQTETPDSQDTKPSSESSSDSTSDDTPDEQQESSTEKSTEKAESKVEEKSSSNETEETEEKDSKQESDQEQETESSQETQETSESSEQSTESSEPVKTPMEDPIDEIKPHSTVVSPIL